MKKISLFLLPVILAAFWSCKDMARKEGSTADKQLDSLLTIGHMTPELLWKLGRVGDAALSPDGKAMIYTLTKYNIKNNKGKTDLYQLSTDGGEPKKLTDFPGGVSNPCYRPDGEKIGFLYGKKGPVQIWEMTSEGIFQKQISNFDNDINGFVYSPNLKHLAWFAEVKVDTIPQEKYPDLPKANARIINNLMYRHWNAWHDYTYSHIFIAPYDEGHLGEAVDIMAGLPYDAPVKPGGGSEQLCWSPDGAKLAFVCKWNKGKEYALSTNSDIFLYDLQTKKISNLTEGMPGYDMDPVFSPDGKRIVWRSMATPGYESDKDRIMVHHFGDRTTKDYSASFDQSSSNFRWSADGNTIYFISGAKGTHQIYKLSLSDGAIQKITEGYHDYTNIWIQEGVMTGTKMSMSLPTEIFRIDIGTGNETQLSFTNKKILDKITLARVEERWIKTTDGKEMLTWVLYPPDFDPAKKYPALLYCQGGPQSMVSQFFSYRWNLQLMASNGYIVVAPNRRGLPGFGQEWNDQIAGDYGGQNIKDYLSAIDAVSAEPYVDKDHLGAVGASYGGFSVFYLAGHHEGRFKAFISHCGMFNLESQYAATEEYFFVDHDLGGPFWQQPKPKSYEFSPHRFVEKWDTPIMISTGGNDFRIPYTESLQAFNCAQLKGIPSKLVFFPEETHFILKPQNSILWQREFFSWLDQWLKV